MRRLDGHTLVSITIEHPSLSTTFSFVDTTLLKTFSVYTGDNDHWLMYLPDGNFFTAGPGSSWSITPGNSA